MINSPKYGLKTIFIVPAFEILVTEASQFSYSSLTKKQLTDLIFLEEIAPFHQGTRAQACNHYEVWYKAKKPYLLNFKRLYCHWAYEPWFIIHKNISSHLLYKWDDWYIGRGLNKVERVYNLRHFCFKFIVMNDLFIIHSTKLHYQQKVKKN